MRAVVIDYAKRPVVRWPGYLLLAMAIVAAAWVSYDYFAVSRRLADAEVAVSRLERRVARGQETAPTIQDSGNNTVVQRAGEIVRKLSVRWDRLFEALESLRHEQVALLSVEPDAANGSVRLLAEAKDTSAMLEYLEQAQESGVLTSVVLGNHQVVEQNPYRPVRFAFSGTWVEKP